MPTQLRFLVSISGDPESPIFHTAVQEFQLGTGWTTQASFSGGSASNAVGQAKDYADENYPGNDPGP